MRYAICRLLADYNIPGSHDSQDYVAAADKLREIMKSVNNSDDRLLEFASELLGAIAENTATKVARSFAAGYSEGFVHGSESGAGIARTIPREGYISDAEIKEAKAEGGQGGSTGSTADSNGG